jgi:mono/diheme cytochrome c family protein
MTSRICIPTAILIATLALAAAQNKQDQPKTDTVRKTDFAHDIQPILAANCYKCHGPAMQMARLRLDAKKTALAGGQSGKVILPGNAAGSILYQRVSGTTKLERMPMGPTALSPEQIALIRDWINQGADWPDGVGAQIAEIKTHWAFVPPVRPPVPTISNASWARNPIDNFIFARLAKESLSPSPEADKATLFRRLSLDLIGLPPTIEELNAFLADKSPNAYEKQVDRLLASPHYGERWARVWLDAARYADSNGYEKDAPRSVWFYRDWVLRAFNQDLPYNQFIIDQIAGDLLPHPTQDQVVATGFLRNSMLNEEGGVDPEQFRMEAMFDRMDAIGKGILGLTIQCAQCHNHKFDPLKQEEYYRMMAFLNQTSEASAVVYKPDQLMKRAEILRNTSEIEDKLRRDHPDWQKRMAAWETSVVHDQPDWTVMRPEVDDISTGGSRYLPQSDGSFLALGYAPPFHKVKFTEKVTVSNITAFRLEVLADPNLPCSGPGRSINGTGVLSEFEADAAPVNDPTKIVKVKFVKATSDLELPPAPLPERYQSKSGTVKMGGPAAFAIDGKDSTGWSTDAGPGLRNQSRKVVFVADKPIGFPGGTILHIYLTQNGGNEDKDDNGQNSLGRMRLSFSTAENAVADPLPQSVRNILAIPADQRSPAQIRAIFSYWRKQAPEWSSQNDQIAALWREYPEGESQLVFSQREQPRETHILQRGNFLTPGAVVQPGVPAFLPPLPPDAPPNRLTFANWLVARNSPTTARSIVNRIWQSYFGTGIVATSENFGTQSDPPSHPELLDWLAVQFMDDGWDLKKLHRLIVTSSTYKQASSVSPEILAKDPANRLLERGPRFRVDAEIVRDIALDASGLLDPEIGGPSVHPYAPEFLFLPPASYARKTWIEDHGPERYRRALYTFRFRSTPYPILQAFDAPNGDFACVRRARSNTPLQALATLNEPVFVESARALALRTLHAGGNTDSDRLSYAFRLCVSRKPSSQEQEVMLAFLQKQEQRLSTGWLSARELTGFAVTDKTPLPPDVTPNQWAAWTAVSRVLLNLDETVTKE